mmetsp:Transcript_47756/g.111376  ORF Transcript_47756/g.111376 Transcript_47756/m.111376 type:complete len:276 (-) Transcript_47756:181-1008(-)
MDTGPLIATALDLLRHMEACVHAIKMVPLLLQLLIPAEGFVDFTPVLLKAWRDRAGNVTVCFQRKESCLGVQHPIGPFDVALDLTPHQRGICATRAFHLELWPVLLVKDSVIHLRQYLGCLPSARLCRNSAVLSKQWICRVRMHCHLHSVLIHAAIQLARKERFLGASVGHDEKLSEGDEEREVPNLQEVVRHASRLRKSGFSTCDTACSSFWNYFACCTQVGSEVLLHLSNKAGRMRHKYLLYVRPGSVPIQFAIRSWAQKAAVFQEHCASSLL